MGVVLLSLEPSFLSFLSQLLQPFVRLLLLLLLLLLLRLGAVMASVLSFHDPDLTFSPQTQTCSDGNVATSAHADGPTDSLRLAPETGRRQRDPQLAGLSQTQTHLLPSFRQVCL